MLNKSVLTSLLWIEFYPSPPCQFYVGALTLNETIFRDWANHEVTREGPCSSGISILMRRDTREISPQMCSKRPCEHSRRGPPSLGTKKRGLTGNQALDLLLPNCEKIIICCLSHPIYGICWGSPSWLMQATYFNFIITPQ